MIIIFAKRVIVLANKVHYNYNIDSIVSQGVCSVKVGNWKIIFSSYEGLGKKAVELLSKEMGAQVLRNKGRYTIHVLPCEKEGVAALDRNAVVIGLHNESALIRQYITANEIKTDGYVIKVVDNPETAGTQLVLITANDSAALFYGAVDFVDDCFVEMSDKRGAMRFTDEALEMRLPDIYRSSAPAIKTRCVFTWGHPINDYRNYIENMARLKLNELIIWNDFVPLNAKDIVAFAHEYGIKVIWGFAWGWSRNCDRIDLGALDALSDSIIKTYEEQYRDLGADGIYFQSFTELQTDKIGDKVIAQVVTDFVNSVSRRILDKYPALLIQFGLHASSVKDHLHFIADVDDRVEIMWEDCGAFPYGGEPAVEDEKAFADTVVFTDKILKLREKGAVSMLFKGFVTLDWIGDHFVHQAGPFIMGDASKALIEHDIEMLKPIWKQIQSSWLQNGAYVHTMAKHIANSGNDGVTVGMAGQFAGGIWLPEALCAQILWECDAPYTEIFDKVVKRKSVDIV